MVQKIIGRRIQEIRKQKGLTQEQMAERVNISPHYLSALERGVYLSTIMEDKIFDARAPARLLLFTPIIVVFLEVT